MGRILQLAVVVVLACGCSAGTDQQMAVVAAGIASVERGAPVTTIVLADGLAEETQQAARRVRPTVAEGDLRPGAKWELPPGHFVLKGVEVSGAEARVVGLMGPVPVIPPGVGRLSCGVHHSINLHREAGGWKVGETELLQC
jgi:hypothetical protein